MNIDVKAKADELRAKIQEVNSMVAALSKSGVSVKIRLIDFTGMRNHADMTALDVEMYKVL